MRHEGDMKEHVGRVKGNEGGVKGRGLLGGTWDPGGWCTRTHKVHFEGPVNEAKQALAEEAGEKARILQDLGPIHVVCLVLHRRRLRAVGAANFVGGRARGVRSACVCAAAAAIAAVIANTATIDPNASTTNSSGDDRGSGF